MIPKIIHYCWLSGDPYPPFIEKCINSWKRYLPDYEFVLWDKAKLDSLQSKWASQAFENNKFAFAADYIRCYAVFNYGGIYLDTDVEVFKSFDQLLFNDSFIGFDSRGDLEAAVFGATRKVPWLKKALDFYEGRDFVDESGNFNITTMPNVFRMALDEELHAIIDRQNISRFPCVSFYPYDFFSPKDYTTGIARKTNNTVTIHHFNAGWLKDNKKLMIRHKVKLLVSKICGEKLIAKILGR